MEAEVYWPVPTRWGVPALLVVMALVTGCGADEVPA